MGREAPLGVAVCGTALAVAALALGWETAATVLAGAAAVVAALTVLVALAEKPTRGAHRRTGREPRTGALDEIVAAVLEVRATGTSTREPLRRAADTLYRLLHAHASGDPAIPPELVEVPAAELMRCWEELPGVTPRAVLDGARHSMQMGYLPAGPAVQESLGRAVAAEEFTTSDTQLLDWVHGHLDETDLDAAAESSDRTLRTFVRVRRAAPGPNPPITGRVLRILTSLTPEVLETYLQLVEDAAGSLDVDEDDHLKLIQMARDVNA